MSDLLYAVESAISMELVIEPANDCVGAGVTETLEAARAAITAVFDWLAEPSGEAKHDGRYAIGGEPDSSADTEEAAADCWAAMLAEMRKQALG